MCDDNAKLRTDALLRPFWKASLTREVGRPVAVSEALLKYALNVAVDLEKKAIAKVLGTEQYGCGHAAGPGALVTDVRSVAALAPDRALAQLDQDNAFGRVDRNQALRAIIDHWPGLARLMSTVWGARGQRLFAEIAPGQWIPIMIYGGVLQGGQDGFSGEPVHKLVSKLHRH